MTDGVTEGVTTPTEDVAPDGEQPAKKRWRITTEKVKVGLLAVIAACLVIIVFQNFFPTEREVRGYVDAYVDGGALRVNGGYVDVGGEVNIGNLGSMDYIQGGLMRASYNVGYDAIPVRIVDCSKTLDVNIEEVGGYDTYGTIKVIAR